MKLYNSRWWAGLVGLLIPVLNYILGSPLSDEQVVTMGGIIATFIVGESYRKAKNGG